jgi:hypothetical protein
MSGKADATVKGVPPTSKDSDVGTKTEGRQPVAQDEKKDSTIAKDASK